jgi:hypothetical protein
VVRLSSMVFLGVVARHAMVSVLRPPWRRVRRR